MQTKSVLSSLAVAVLGGAVAIAGYTQWENNTQNPSYEQPTQTVVQPTLLRTAAGAPIQSDDFSLAAENAVNSVVHVKTAVEQGYYVSPFRGFSFGNSNMTPRIVEGSGSGVIISENGFIVTNNHVVENAQSVEVTLNDNRQVEARVVGTDPTTDIAVLKVDVEGLHPLPFANSDEIRLGQWVLAVGNPFNLTSTVTAGIVSAKGRSINIIDERSAIESFIQTDAVVNPGNSGGALVNLQGDLVGINTAISTHTGTFEGYSFAVPSNLVQKVVDDIIRYGMVQRAYLGVNIANVTPQMATELDLDRANGVYVSNVVSGSAAEEAGIETGDVITQIDQRPITKTSELLEVVGSKRPGDHVAVTVNRNGSSRTFELTLTNSEGNTELVTAEEARVQVDLGASFKTLSDKEKAQLRLKGGVIVTNPGQGKLAEAGVPAGFIITKINNHDVATQEDIENVIREMNAGDGLLIQGFKPNGRPAYYAFGM